MKLTAALGVACAGLAVATVTAYAQPNTPAPNAPRNERRVVIHGGGGPGMHMAFFGEADANNDGWLSRAEAQAQADRMFDHMDSNDDRKLDSNDRPAMGGGEGHEFNFRTSDGGDVVIERGAGSPGNRTIIIRRGEGDDDVEVRAGGEGDQHIERHVTIIRNHGDNDDDNDSRPRAPRAPRAAHGAHPPMFAMLYANSEEADRNNDGALSQEEFRAQQLRFFDASDANGDGKIRFPRIRMPEPPTPPTAPTPPAPPARR